MRTTMILSGAALLFGVICFGAADEKVVPKRADKASPQPAAKAVPKAITTPTEKTPASLPVTRKQSADEEAIRQMDDAFL